jgi:hypothetical protein
MEENVCIAIAETYETVVHVLFENDENYWAKILLHEMLARMHNAFYCILLY